jgi:transcriptional regulator with XRE-family HTH domain
MTTGLIAENRNGEIIRKARQDCKLSVRAMANLIGISHTHLTRIENGERPLTPELSNRHAVALAKHLRGESK